MGKSGGAYAYIIGRGRCSIGVVPKFYWTRPHLVDVGAFFPSTEQIVIEVPGHPELNFTTNVLIASNQVVLLIVVIKGLDRDQMMEMVVFFSFFFLFLLPYSF